jgi:hypothetical protein
MCNGCTLEKSCTLKVFCDNYDPTDEALAQEADLKAEGLRRVNEQV